MPRIGGGGGPVVPPQTQGAQQAQQTNKGDFASKIQQAQAPNQATPAAQAQQARQAQQSRMTGKVREIAKRVANGQVDQKEATREFVSLVIEERFPQFKKKKKKKRDDEDDDGTPEERLEEAVTELINRDPSLARRLETQFKKLAKV